MVKMKTSCPPVLAFALAIATTLANCSCSSKLETTGSPTKPVRSNFPERVGSEGDGTGLTKLEIQLVSDRDVISVNLDSPVPAGSNALSYCYDVPDAGFVLGRLICSDDAAHQVTLTAANARFTCINNVDFGVFPERQALDLKGCAIYDVYVERFLPVLDVTVAPPA